MTNEICKLEGKLEEAESHIKSLKAEIEYEKKQQFTTSIEGNIFNIVNAYPWYGVKSVKQGSSHIDEINIRLHPDSGVHLNGISVVLLSVTFSSLT